jgi:hypothetical protein
MFAPLVALLLIAPPEVVDPERFCEATCENPDVVDARRQRLADANNHCSADCERRYPNPDKTVSFVTDQCMLCIDRCNTKLDQDQKAMDADIEACTQACRTQVQRHRECCKTVDGYTTCTESCLKAQVHVPAGTAHR